MPARINRLKLKLDMVTLAFAIAAVAGAVFLIGSAFRIRTLTAELKQIEEEIHSLTQTQLALERSHASSAQLPALLELLWERAATSGFEKAASETGATIYRLQYTKSASQGAKNVGTANFELELAGNQEALLRSISLVRAYVHAAKIETIDISPGKGKSQGLYTLKLTGVVYYLGEIKAGAAAK